MENYLPELDLQVDDWENLTPLASWLIPTELVSALIVFLFDAVCATCALNIGHMFSLVRFIPRPIRMCIP